MVQIHSLGLISATHLALTGLKKSYKFNIDSRSHQKPVKPSVIWESGEHSSWLQLPILLYSLRPLPLRSRLLFWPFLVCYALGSSFISCLRVGVPSPGSVFCPILFFLNKLSYLNWTKSDSFKHISLKQLYLNCLMGISTWSSDRLLKPKMSSFPRSGFSTSV